MKKQFIIEAYGSSAQDAFESTKVPGKEVCREVKPDDDIVSDVRRKAARVAENPELYADKAQTLAGILTRWELSDRGPMAKAQLMLDNGDPWVEHPQRCRVIASGNGKYLVFGYTFE